MSSSRYWARLALTALSRDRLPAEQLVALVMAGKNKHAKEVTIPSRSRREGVSEAPRSGREQRKSAWIANAAAGSSRSKVARKGGKSGSYDDWSKQDLVQRAREIGIKGRSKMIKAELVIKLAVAPARRAPFLR